MADFNQVGGRHVFDVPMANVANAGNADIPAGSGVLVDTVSSLPSLYAAIQPTAAGGVLGSVGVAMETMKFGGAAVPVRIYGSAQMIAHGAITAGDEIQISDTAGHLGQAKTKGAGVAAIGFVLAGCADGDPIEVFLFHARNA